MTDALLPLKTNSEVFEERLLPLLFAQVQFVDLRIQGPKIVDQANAKHAQRHGHVQPR